MIHNRIYKYSPHDSAENRRMYDIWNGMRKRCRNENCVRYKDYGGRGIDFCKEWENFDNFVEWAKVNGYESTLTLDRIDNDGDYTPENCRWATVKAQNRNKRTCVMVEYKGETKSLVDWCEELGLPYYTIQKRIKKGMDPKDALEKPVRSAKDSIASKCRERGIKPQVVYDRVLKLGWDLEKALDVPARSIGSNQKSSIARTS